MPIDKKKKHPADPTPDKDQQREEQILDPQQQAIRYKAFQHLFGPQDLKGNIDIDDKKILKKLKESRNLEKGYAQYLKELAKNPDKVMVFPWDNPFRRFIFWLTLWGPRLLKWAMVSFVLLFIINYIPGPTQHIVELAVSRSLYDTARLQRLPETLESYAHSANIVDAGGAIIKSYGKRRVTWEIPDHVKRTLLACEDHYLLPHPSNPWYVNTFMIHAGVSWWNIFGAVKDNLRGRRRGASTIVMQNAKKILGNNQRTIGNKLEEIIIAYMMVSKFGKDKNLNFYINTVPVGGNMYGFPAAARNYFKKDLDELTVQQVAAIASFIPNHNRQLAFYQVVEGKDFDNLDDSMRRHAQSAMAKVNSALSFLRERGEISDADYQKWRLSDEESIRKLGLRTYRSPLYGEEEWTSWNVIREICSRNYLVEGREITGAQLLLDEPGDVVIETEVDLVLVEKIKEIITTFLASPSYRDVLERRNRRLWERDLDRYLEFTDTPPFRTFKGFMDYLYRNINVGVIIINQEGDIISYVGGKEFLQGEGDGTDSGDGDSTRVIIDLMNKKATIAPSSTIKPVIAYYAMVNNNATLETRFVDKPLEYKYSESLGRKIWLPRNSYAYDPKGSGRNRYLGRKYTLLDAQIYSVNTIFARLYTDRVLRNAMLIGLDKIGLDYDKEDARYWPFGIGATQVPVQQWLGVYNSFLDGNYREPSLVRRITVNGQEVYNRRQDESKEAVALFDAKTERKETMRALYEICNRGTAAGIGKEFKYHKNLISGKTGTAQHGRSTLFISHFNPYRDRTAHPDKNLTMIVAVTTNTGGYKSVGTSSQGPVKIAGRIYDYIFDRELQQMMDNRIEQAKKKNTHFRNNHLYWSNVNRYMEKMLHRKNGRQYIYECMIGIENYEEALEQILNSSNRIYSGRDQLFDQLVDFYCDQEKIVKMGGSGNKQAP